MKISRPEKAGEKLGEVIVEMVNLYYQNKTAEKFYKGLLTVLKDELVNRGLWDLGDWLTTVSRRIQHRIIENDRNDFK